jgi:hypothetical protein
VGVYYSKLVALALSAREGTETIRHTHSGDLEVIEFWRCQDGNREWLNLAEPFPTRRMPVAALKEGSRIMGISGRSRTDKQHECTKFVIT